MSNESIYRAFGAQISTRRRELGLTQSKLAARTGMSRASIANIESGRQNVMLHQVYVLSVALELDRISDLLPVQPRSVLDELVISGSAVTAKGKAQIEDLVATMLARQSKKAAS